jgi:hypothetical protein
MASVFRKTLVRSLHVRCFEIDALPASGWIASEREDERVVQQRRYTDWHRVERAAKIFMREVADLRSQGWLET